MSQSTIQQRYLNPITVTRHEVLRQDECEAVRDRVFALKEHWISRSDVGCFFTLGAASYLDAVGHRDAYLKVAREVNPILRANFPWLYKRIRNGFEDLLTQPVDYADEGALPGFHIFTYTGGDQSNDKPSTRAHFDMQWMHAIARHRPEETLSFTLPIEEPSGGCSLEIWPVHCDMVSPETDILEWAATHSSQTLWYSRGQMVVHDGLLLHAIGLSSLATPVGSRLTFQGHGIKAGRQWKLYW